ncbi:MAG: M15 family metallopeptidase [Pseudomonadota bacterium]|nr:MAG: M15 family metallopeptidase [Pseudomonadota bacterium]
MAFKLGKRSLKELEGVHADLVAVVNRAIEITPQDFSVHDGIRTLEEQKKLVKSGASKTLRSRHISGHAVDLVPYINGKLRWEWEPIYQIAEAVRTAAQELEVPIRWGGAWDTLLTSTDEATEDVISGYVERRRSEGKKAFIDGPHYELPRSEYPENT